MSTAQKTIHPLHFANLLTAYSLGHYIKNEDWQEIHEYLHENKSWYRTDFHQKLAFTYNKYIDDKKDFYRLKYENITRYGNLIQPHGKDHHHTKEQIRKLWKEDKLILNVVNSIKYIIIEEEKETYIIIIGLRGEYKIKFERK